jgi:hypothetical protein
MFLNQPTFPAATLLSNNLCESVTLFQLNGWAFDHSTAATVDVRKLLMVNIKVEKLYLPISAAVLRRSACDLAGELIRLIRRRTACMLPKKTFAIETKNNYNVGGIQLSTSFPKTNKG